MKTKSPKAKKDKLINLKITSAEREAIQKNADRYAGGNISKWLRYAGAHLKPISKDFTRIRKS